ASIGRLPAHLQSLGPQLEGADQDLGVHAVALALAGEQVVVAGGGWRRVELEFGRLRERRVLGAEGVAAHRPALCRVAAAGLPGDPAEPARPQKLVVVVGIGVGAAAVERPDRIAQALRQQIAAHLHADLPVQRQPVVDHRALDGEQARIPVELLEAERRLELAGAHVRRREAVPVDEAVGHLRPVAGRVAEAPGEIHLQAEVELLQETTGGVEPGAAQVEAVIGVREAVVAAVPEVALRLDQTPQRERRLLARGLDHDQSGALLRAGPSREQKPGGPQRDEAQSAHPRHDLPPWVEQRRESSTPIYLVKYNEGDGELLGGVARERPLRLWVRRQARKNSSLPAFSGRLRSAPLPLAIARAA